MAITVNVVIYCLRIAFCNTDEISNSRSTEVRGQRDPANSGQAPPANWQHEGKRRCPK